MPIDYIVRQCAPTLAGIKTGNLFPYRITEDCDIYREISALNRQLKDKGIKAVPLKVSKDSVLIYIFRVESLKRDLSDVKAKELLDLFGYNKDCPSRCVTQLARKLKCQDKFPHEIGLFLGYPPEDVEGFILNRAANYKLCGFWKVYGDVKKAKMTFDSYKSCMDEYMRKLRSGCGLDELAVAG